MDSKPMGAKKLKKEYDNFHEDEHSRVGDKGNQILYNMCKKYPNNKDETEIRAKIWLIGRAYSAAIERRKKHLRKSNDKFYNFVTRKIVEFNLDRYIKRIPKNVKLNEENIERICDAHHYLTDKFAFLTGLDKRSLASKYLHFHRPLVPIFDSRAKKTIEGIFKKCKWLPEEIKVKNCDESYKSFVEKIFCFQRFLRDNKCKKYTIRDIDKYLIDKAG